MHYQKKYLPLIIGAAVAVGVLVGGKLNFSDSPEKLFTKNSNKDKLNRLIDFIEYDYVEDINTDSIVDVTVNGILDNLDPHSVYIPREELASVTENMKGDFVGIGVSFYTYRDTITVIRTIEGGPSEKAGIKGGDRILLADGDSLYGAHIKDGDIVSRLKGPEGSDVNLTIYRKGEPEFLSFKVKRGIIPIKSVDAAYMLTDKLGYIKVNRFAESTYKEFKKGLDKLIDLGATEIALDLRDNPGGFLSQAEQIVDEFLGKNKLILFTKNKHGHIEESYATKRGDFENGKIYVLIDENSASASEIVAGALQDNDKGTIVGRRSYGKGLVQREMDLGDGSAVRLTVSRYYTPTGRSIQRPYKKNGHKDYYDEYSDRLERGELLDPRKIEVADSLKFTTPNGKVVYGGGGIIPDIFVPIDNSMQNETLKYILQYQFFDNFIFRQLDLDRHAYDGLSRDYFIRNFELDDSLVIKFQDYVNTQTRTKVTFVAYHDEVKHYLKATLAGQLFGNGAFEEVVNQKDVMIEEVIKLSKEL
ncbi:S41 family peptidase [Seonamhaeicola marinus]|uniref:S41 family peptidase n=1 Tax=Seonamhaeicola marinus TaxID=1912246 RepID=A0A5D0HVD5_9FLAO|nr:S41 family peptidase [Seonamhaeicola marinus]TYA74459.1 S41 family peptidase [Seonamhaeicola marinus]